MSSIFRALAVDFDGTLTSDGKRPHDNVLEAIARARATGCRVLLVPGRILSELRADFPDVDEHVDAIVAENGCVLSLGGSTRLLAPPVDSVLAKALVDLGIPVRVGDALLACYGVHAMTVLTQIRLLGLDAQIIQNRQALMVLPALRRRADIVSIGPTGDGVVELIDGRVFDGRRTVHSHRWDMLIGTSLSGDPVTLPTSQLNLLVCGDTGRGMSYAAGLMAERLIALGYCVLVIDPEGDHRELGRLRGTVTIDAADGLPSPARVASIFRQRFTSVVLDLSCRPPSERRAYLDPESHFRGQILVTFRPFDLALGGEGPLPDSIVEIACRVSGLDEAHIRHLAGGLGPKQGLLAQRPEQRGPPRSPSPPEQHRRSATPTSTARRPCQMRSGSTSATVTATSSTSLGAWRSFAPRSRKLTTPCCSTMRHPAISLVGCHRCSRIRHLPVLSPRPSTSSPGTASPRPRNARASLPL